LLLGDRDERWADDPVVQSVRLLMFFDDSALGLVGLDIRDGLVQIRIERLAERVDGFEALGLEDPAKLALDEPHPFDPRLTLELLRYRPERAVVSVEDVEQPRDEVRLRELCELVPFALIALAVVREVRR